jgi:hypothetical protein
MLPSNLRTCVMTHLICGISKVCERSQGEADLRSRCPITSVKSYFMTIMYIV